MRTNQGLQQRLEAAQQAYNAQGRSLTEATALLAQIRTVVDVSESCGGSDENDKVSAYIGIRTLLSRAPAQPAAPTPDLKFSPAAEAHLDALEARPAAPTHECSYIGKCNSSRCPVHGEPAAPEPPGDDYACADMQGPVVTDRQAAVVWMRRAESAEAQLAAVREVVDAIPESVFTAAEQGMLDDSDAIEAVGDLRIIRSLLTAPSPGAGGGK